MSPGLLAQIALLCLEIRRGLANFDFVSNQLNRIAFECDISHSISPMGFSLRSRDRVADRLHVTDQACRLDRRLISFNASQEREDAADQ